MLIGIRGLPKLLFNVFGSDFDPPITDPALGFDTVEIRVDSTKTLADGFQMRANGVRFDAQMSSVHQLFRVFRLARLICQGFNDPVLDR